MSADDEDLLRMFAAANFADDVCRFHRTVSERVLYVDVHARRDAAFDQAFELALILVRHRNDGNRKIRVKTEDSGVRQIHARGTRTTLPANHGDNAGVRKGLQKITKSAKIMKKSFFGLPFASTNRIFPFKRPRFFASSSRLNKSIVTTSPSAPPAGVEPTQPIASTCSGRDMGERSFASVVPRVHPRQIVYFSVCTFSRPIAFIFAAAHSSDLRSLGDPVTREPMSSLNSARYW